jgi:hypothetical protein
MKRRQATRFMREIRTAIMEILIDREGDPVDQAFVFREAQAMGERIEDLDDPAVRERFGLLVQMARIEVLNSSLPRPI